MKSNSRQLFADIIKSILFVEWQTRALVMATGIVAAINGIIRMGREPIVYLVVRNQGINQQRNRMQVDKYQSIVSIFWLKVYIYG